MFAYYARRHSALTKAVICPLPIASEVTVTWQLFTQRTNCELSTVHTNYNINQYSGLLQELNVSSLQIKEYSCKTVTMHQRIWKHRSLHFLTSRFSFISFDNEILKMISTKKAATDVKRIFFKNMYLPSVFVLMSHQKT